MDSTAFLGSFSSLVELNLEAVLYRSVHLFMMYLWQRDRLVLAFVSHVVQFLDCTNYKSPVLSLREDDTFYEFEF